MRSSKAFASDLVWSAYLWSEKVMPENVTSAPSFKIHCPELLPFESLWLLWLKIVSDLPLSMGWVNWRGWRGGGERANKERRAPNALGGRLTNFGTTDYLTVMASFQLVSNSMSPVISISAPLDAALTDVDSDEYVDTA